MIVYSLRCAKNHDFEAWFRDSEAYEAQASRRAIACPECDSTKVNKAPMAPHLLRGKSAERERGLAERPAAGAKQPAGEAAVMAKNILETLRREIEAKCEYVGERFAEEARKIHYGEVKRRDIYGQASSAEADALTEEGVDFHRIPWARRTDS